MSEDIVPDQKHFIVVDRGYNRPIIFLTECDADNLIIVYYRAREQVDIKALDGGACHFPQVDESVITRSDEDCASWVRTQSIDLA